MLLVWEKQKTLAEERCFNFIISIASYLGERIGKSIFEKSEQFMILLKIVKYLYGLLNKKIR